MNSSATKHCDIDTLIAETLARIEAGEKDCALEKLRQLQHMRAAIEDNGRCKDDSGPIPEQPAVTFARCLTRSVRSILAALLLAAAILAFLDPPTLPWLFAGLPALLHAAFRTIGLSFLRRNRS